jgi:hypothetical protein
MDECLSSRSMWPFGPIEVQAWKLGSFHLEVFVERQLP